MIVIDEVAAQDWGIDRLPVMASSTPGADMHQAVRRGGRPTGRG